MQAMVVIILNDYLLNLVSTNRLENMTLVEREKYLENLRIQLSILKKDKYIINGQKIIENIYPFLRNYEIEIYGEENLLGLENAIFLFNHSNSHDIFTAYEFLSMLKRNGTVMVATDCLNTFSKTIFSMAGSTMFDRNDKKQSLNSIYDFSKKIINGKSGVIFGEATWNLHPVKAMQNIKIGCTKSAQLSKVPIIPTIMEYVEVPDMIKNEKDLINRCIITIGKPIFVNYDDSLIKKVQEVQLSMEIMRKKLWKQLNIKKDSLDDINKELYLNHTYIKKFKAFGFVYDSEKEFKFLRSNNGETIENEYTINSNAEFVPGVTKNKKI